MSVLVIFRQVLVIVTAYIYTAFDFLPSNAQSLYHPLCQWSLASQLRFLPIFSAAALANGLASLTERPPRLPLIARVKRFSSSHQQSGASHQHTKQTYRHAL